MARAAYAGRRVRAVGSGHSFTDIACTDDVMVSLRQMARVVDADAGSGLVRVQGGIRLHELGAELAARGLAMENQGDVDMQTIAGAVATATHGTGVRFRNLSSQVAAVRLVTADGTVEASEDSDPEALLAARVGLGALGIVSELTLRCPPLFTLHRHDAPSPLARTLERLDELADAHDHFEFFVFPYADTALTRVTERTDRAPRPPSRVRAWVQDVALENAALGAAMRAGRAAPRAIPRLNRALTAMFSEGRRTDLSHRIYANPRHVRFTEMEYALPREAGREVVERVLGLIERRRLPISFPLEVRFVAADDAFLSPAHGRTTCYVAVHVYRGMEFESYFRAVEAIMDEHGGRPHWGKRHYQSASTLRPRYPDWQRFQAVRRRLDPAGTFANAYTDRVLGAVEG